MNEDKEKQNKKIKREREKTLLERKKALGLFQVQVES